MRLLSNVIYCNESLRMLYIRRLFVTYLTTKLTKNNLHNSNHVDDLPLSNPLQLLWNEGNYCRL